MNVDSRASVYLPLAMQISTRAMWRAAANEAPNSVNVSLATPASPSNRLGLKPMRNRLMLAMARLMSSMDTRPCSDQ